jgi:hypothetical protein
MERTNEWGVAKEEQREAQIGARPFLYIAVQGPAPNLLCGIFINSTKNATELFRAQKRGAYLFSSYRLNLQALMTLMAFSSSSLRLSFIFLSLASLMISLLFSFVFLVFAFLLLP